MATYHSLQTNRTYYPSNNSYDAAVKASTAALTHLSDNSKYFNNTLNFIGKVALNERKKELDSIQNYCKKLQTDFNFKKGSEIAETLAMTPDEIAADPDKFQNALIIAFDASRRDLETTKKTIGDILNASGVGEFGPLQARKFDDYAHSQYVFKMVGDLDTLVNRLTNNFAKNQLNDNTISGRLDRIVIQALNKLNIPQQLANGKTVVELGTFMLADLEKQFQQALDNDPHAKTFEDLSPEILDAIENKYLEGMDSHNPTSELQATLLKGFNNNPQLMSSLNNIGTILNLTEDPKAIISEVEELPKFLEEDEKEERISLEKSLEQFHGKLNENPALRESLYRIKLSISGNDTSKHGNIYELIESLIRGEKVRENVATDLITIHFDYQIEQDSEKITRYIRSVSDALSSIQTYIQKNKSHKSLDGFKQQFNRVNKALRSLYQLIENEMQNIDKFKNQKMFVQHESLKMSTTANREAGHGFKGRTMNIVSYLGYLSSMASAGAKINMNELEFLSYNILPHAAAATSEARKTLQSYFSMFAAMMMFDDVQQMAQEALQGVQSLTSSGNVEVLHVYNLNNLFVPASTVMTTVYNQLQAAGGLISQGGAVSASISIKSGAKSVNDISVSIKFMSNFLDTIQALYTAMD